MTIFNLMSENADEVKRHALQLVAEGRNDEAIAYLRTQFGISGTDAERLLQTLAPSIPPAPQDIFRRVKPLFGSGTGCAVIILRVIAIFLCFFAFGFVLSCGIMYITNSVQISNSDLVEGEVIDFDRTEDGAAPIIDYHLNGESHHAKGTVYSTPPAYVVGEIVEVYVKREDPSSVLINTYMERWQFIVFFGTAAALFLLPAIILFIIASRLRRKTRF